MKQSTKVLFILFLLFGCKSSPTDEKDSTPPTVAIVSPSNNSTIADSILITVDATDNIGVEKVEFYIDGNLANTRSVAPWTYNWNIQSVLNKTTHTLHAKAYDASSNIGSSSTISVTVNNTGQVLKFNGLTDYVTLPSSASLTSFTNQITVEAWVRMDLDSAGIVLSSGNENEYSLVVHANGKLGVTMVMVNPQVNAEFIGKGSVPVGVWTHVAFTYDGSTESILINGVVDTSFSATGNVSTSQYTENLTIGAYSWSNFTLHNTFLNGALDDVRVWNVARSAAQISASMNAELSGSETGLVGYWKFNSNAADSSANGNHGTIVGTPTFEP